MSFWGVSRETDSESAVAFLISECSAWSPSLFSQRLISTSRLEESPLCRKVNGIRGTCISVGRFRGHLIENSHKEISFNPSLSRALRADWVCAAAHPLFRQGLDLPGFSSLLPICHERLVMAIPIS